MSARKEREAWWLAPGATREEAIAELKEFAMMAPLILLGIALLVGAFLLAGIGIKWVWFEMVRAACKGGHCK